MKYLDENGNRIYSNETMRRFKAYIDKHSLKKDTEGYNETLDREEIPLSNKVLRTKEEKLADKENINNA